MKINLHKAIASAIITCGLVMAMGKAHAEDEALITDRPDFTESPQVVPPGRVQVEGGYTYSREGAAREHALGEVLVRVSVNRKMEMRIGVPSYLWQRDGGRSSGIDDAFLGGKIALSSGGGKKPATALLFGTSLPTGAKAVGSDAWQPEAVLAASWDLCPTTALSINLGAARPVEAGTRFSQLFGSLSVGHSLNAKWGTFAEAFGFNKADATGKSAKYANGGVTYLINNDLQLDARFGIGLNNHAGGLDFFTGFGVARRF